MRGDVSDEPAAFKIRVSGWRH